MKKKISIVSLIVIMIMSVICYIGLLYVFEKFVFYERDNTVDCLVTNKNGFCEKPNLKGNELKIYKEKELKKYNDYKRNLIIVKILSVIVLIIFIAFIISYGIESKSIILPIICGIIIILMYINLLLYPNMILSFI